MNTVASHSAATGRIESAADWHARLRSPGCSADERTAFETWCIEDSRNIDAWLAVAEIAEHDATLRDDPQLRAAAQAARHGATFRDERRSRRRNFLFSTAALLALAIGFAGWNWHLQDETIAHYSTTIGEQRTLRLEDGTQIVLDTDSQITTRFDRSRREVEVERGRVDIIVARDTSREFEVIAANGHVRDIGTRFQVSRHAEDVTVTLLEGQVGVRLASNPADETMLSPGQQLIYRKQGPIERMHDADLESASGWTRGELIFKDRSLDDLLGELNRYTAKPLRLAEPGLGSRPISGVFHINDQASLLKALDLGWGLVVQQDSGNEIVLEQRKNRAH